ncbi:glycoside hydrolase family 5 protein [Tunicatimonas pelagia]|uniref:glycoside hydrolase family 5 protein n=1 Tax=Tunicatimonas pelagia TaxID=931531 RepID=UPI00266586CC|nr:cellulase family glycosylhydrolase [Tunicatimonas pelagia]WKN42650.1 cellulase family glycosylhydrolase [Tunicatimonas pelagia]
MRRRSFVKAGAASAVLAATGLPSCKISRQVPEVTADNIPMWKGFNLLEKFDGQSNKPYRESDFKMMADWGFNFARLPMSYWTWGDVNDWSKIDEATLKHIDEAINYGQKHRVHVNLNFHRAPGYCINGGDLEPYQLFEDEEAQDATRFHWRTFAKRYQGIPNYDLSFDLLNEPPFIPEAQHNPVMLSVIEAIRDADPDRLIVVDGLAVGRDPIIGFADKNVVQSTRGYDPMRVSHHEASWIPGSDIWPEPTWPLTTDEETVDQAKLRQQLIEPWQTVVTQGVKVHVGEWGAYNQTPHEVALAWMEDLLQLWQEAGWGWALWNLRGSFGVLDSGREDVEYEDYQGHKLDRKMLELLQAYL